MFDLTAEWRLFFSCPRAIGPEAREKMLNTARGRQKSAESAPCAREGQRDAHALSARVAPETAAFWALSARVRDISDRTGLFTCE